MTDLERIGILSQRVLRDERKRQWRIEMPPEPFRREWDTEEPVVWFQQTFGKESERNEPMPPVYTYVAHKIGPDQWQMVRNRVAVRYTWSQLWEFAALRQYSPPVIYRATQWEVVS